LTYVNGILAYFDQYALSHRVWAPDSSSILLPEVAADGSTHISVRPVGGDPPIMLEGELAFWSPQPVARRS
jgi:TolB protein